MKQYLCIKDYVTSDNRIAFKKGKIYDLKKTNFLDSEEEKVSYYFPGNLKKNYFKKHKPVKSFGGNGLYDISTSGTMSNGVWMGNITTNGKELMRLDANGNIVDSVVQAVINKFKDRSDVGIKKYGTTLDRKDINFDGWAEHLQQELMDGILYLERLRNEK